MLYAIIVIACAIVGWKWARGIDYMKDFHSDYKGEDFL